MHPNLSFEQAPPISVPYRFFLTAPWFGMVAGVLLLVEGDALLTSRWLPGTLALVHLFVAGFMLQAMCGALLQFIPVAAGGNIWRPQWLAAVVHPLLVVATMLLVAAFLTARPGLFIAAGHAFAVGLGFFVLVVGMAIWRTPAKGATIVALRIALVALLVTLLTGVTLVTGLAKGLLIPLPPLVNVHAAWGLGGWALILLAGVSYFVVPMFQLTPAYPTWFARGMPWALVVLVGIWSLLFPDFSEPQRTVVLFASLAVAASYGAMTLYMHARRRRKVSDTSFLFFRLAMLSLLILFLTALLTLFWDDEQITVWQGVLALFGVFFSVINGMLYKIMPFINWLQLQRHYGMQALPPTMNQMLADSQMRAQFRVHLAALVMLLLAVWLPVLARPAGLLLALDCGWLALNLLRIVAAYRRFKARVG